MRLFLPLFALSCTPDPCPAGATRKGDGLCHLVDDSTDTPDSDERDTGSTAALSGYTALSVGGSTVCAIRAGDQGMDCTLLGAAALADFGQATPPTGRFTSVSVGALHACARTIDGTVRCWGQADELGDGKLAPFDGTYTGVTAGLTASCAWTADSTLTCATDATDESELTTEENVLLADAGPRNTLRLLADGRIAVAPDGDDFNQSAPADDPFVAVAMGGTFSCGRTETGRVLCVGDDYHGQLQAPDGRFTDVDAGVVHVCGLAEDGTATCWGNNDYGQAEPPDEPLTAISTGADVSCGLDTAGGLQCWGATEAPTEPASDATLSHASHIQPIWDAHCIHCHNGWESGRLNLVGAAGYGAMTGETWRQLAEPGDPTNSLVMGRLDGTEGPRMPPGYSLDPVLVARIKAWISQGAAP